MTHLQVGHEVFEDGGALLLQQVLQADDKRNRVLYEDLLVDLETTSGKRCELQDLLLP